MRVVGTVVSFTLLSLTPAVAGLLVAPRTTAAQADAKSPQMTRFDTKVRNDFFSGFAGDSKALDRGMQACETTLKEQPNHAEALVWHGCGLQFRAGQAFSKGNTSHGLTLWNTSMEEMDRAVKLAPTSIAVRVPRATCLIPSSRFVPAAQQKELLLRAREDLELVRKVQEPRMAKLSTHSRGELLMGLAEVYLRLGEADKAKETLTAVTRTCASTPYAARAAEWLTSASSQAGKTKFYHNCIGCHE